MWRSSYSSSKECQSFSYNFLDINKLLSLSNSCGDIKRFAMVLSLHKNIEKEIIHVPENKFILPRLSFMWGRIIYCAGNKIKIKVHRYISLFFIYHIHSWKIEKAALYFHYYKKSFFYLSFIEEAQFLIIWIKCF